MGAVVPSVRKGRKLDQVLDGARQIFLTQGYEGASVDDIAREAGVSKATLYSYFADKRLLFLEVCKGECCRLVDETQGRVCHELPPAQALSIIGRTLVDFFTSEFGMRMFRIFVAESERFPELGREFYESGPALGQARMMEYLTEGVEAGHFAIDDFPLAADQFTEMCKADLFPRLIFGVMARPSDAQKDRIVQGAVSTFLARYGVVKG